MKTVDVDEAAARLDELLDAVERGEEIVITRGGTPVARLVPVEQPGKRVRGAWRNEPGWENFVYDPAIFAPMTDEEMKEEGWE